MLVFQSAWLSCMHKSSLPCGTTRESASIRGRHNCGTVQVCSPLVASMSWMQGGEPFPPVIVWRGDQSLPTREQGIRVLGTPLGHGDHVEAEVLTTNEEHRFAVCVAPLALLHICQGEPLVAGCPPVVVRRFCESTRHFCVELCAPVVGHPQHARDDGQSRDVFGKRRAGVAERFEGQGQCILGQ